MISERNIKVILQIILFTTLGLYIIVAELPEILFGLKATNPNLLWIFKILGIFISSFVILSSFKIKWFLKLLLGKGYVAGSYSGYSEKIGKNREVIKTHIEELEIIQTLLSTTISGISKTENGKFYSKWYGRLIDFELDNYKFIIQMQTPLEELTAILTLKIANDKINGFGLGVEVGESYSWKFDLDAKK